MQWMQRSRANWLKNRDKNTSFFHAYASARRKKNYIKCLKDDNGYSLEDTAVLNNHIQNYFSQLFTSEVGKTDPNLLEKVENKVTQCRGATPG